MSCGWLDLISRRIDCFWANRVHQQFNDGQTILLFLFAPASFSSSHYFIFPLPAHVFILLLFTDFAGSATQLVADVDCTTDGKALCDQVGVRGYPTIKWGDPSDLQDYQGGRDYDALKKFCDENLKPMCSPKNIDLCDADKKAQITKYQGMSDDELAAAITAEEKKLDDAEANFKAEVQKLQDKYSALSQEKDDTIASVKDAGLGLMKAVKNSKPSGSDEL